MNRRVLFLLSLLIFFGFSFAQPVTEDSLVAMLERSKTYYYNGEYESAIRELENALKYLKQLKVSDQVEAYTYLAFSYVAFGERTKAKEQFRRALQLNPDLELDAATVSPKIIKVFEEVKAEIATLPPPEPAKPSPIVATRKVSTLDATIRSCCIGGWGQIYKGERSKGKKLMIAWGVSGGTTLLSWLITAAKHDEYKKATSNLDEAYKDYKLWVNIAAVNSLVFISIYAYNLYDVIFHKPSSRTSMLDAEEGFVCRAYKDNISIGYHIRF